MARIAPAEAPYEPSIAADLARIMPTGGVSPDEANLRGWLAAGAACVGMGSQLVRSEWVKAGDFDAIAETVKRTLALIRKIRAEV